MRRRLQLHEKFLEITPNVFYQPPANVQMAYPCIIYKRDAADTQFAGNKPYAYTQRYMVTAISRDPDDELHEKIALQPMCLFNRNYAANGLHHDVFNLYF